MAKHGIAMKTHQIRGKIQILQTMMESNSNSNVLFYHGRIQKCLMLLDKQQQHQCEYSIF